MTGHRHLRTGLCALAIVVLSATLMQMAPAAAGDGAKLGRVDGAKAEHPAAKDAGPTETQSRDASDTRITVWFHRQRGKMDGAVKLDRARELKSVRKPSDQQKNLTHREFTLRRSNHIARNAIGARVVRHDDAKPDAVSKAQASIAPAVEPARQVGSEPMSVGKLNPMHTVASAIAIHTTINGTILSRQDPLPHTLGGPAKMLAGISGNMIRPRH
jgi:hypothetical protein